MFAMTYLGGTGGRGLDKVIVWWIPEPLLSILAKCTEELLIGESVPDRAEIGV